MQKGEQENLKVAMKDAALSVVKILVWLAAGTAIISGSVLVINTLSGLLETAYVRHAVSMRYIACVSGCFFLVCSNWLWRSYRRYTEMNGREPSGAAGTLLLSGMVAGTVGEILTAILIFWMSVQGGDDSLLMAGWMSVTALFLVVSTGIRLSVVTGN